MFTNNDNALILAGTTLLMIAPIGNVIVGGKDAADTRGLSQSRALASQGGSASMTSATRADACFARRRSGGTAGHVKPATAGRPGRSPRLRCKSVFRTIRMTRSSFTMVSTTAFYGTSRITEHATIRVERPLPPNIRIAEEPWATSVVLLRGIPGTLNTPALDPALMYDLRAAHSGGSGARRDPRSCAEYGGAYCRKSWS